MKAPIGVIGAGSWGTTLANLLAEKGERVLLWAREAEICREINEKHKNSVYLPGFLLSKSVKATQNLEEIAKNCHFLVNAAPSHVTREVWKQIAPHIYSKSIVVNASKGLEEKTFLRMSSLLQEVLPALKSTQITALSGPSFAKEVMEHQPTTVVIAGFDKKIISEVQHLFRTETFLTYTHDDLIGVEIGGALKNVIAIACGIVDGMKLGSNTRAALITRGLYEMAKLGKELGANPLTFAGLTGIGDLILTCTGDLSRNRSVGMQLGQGKKTEEILCGMREIAEGVKTSKAVYELSESKNVNMPICKEIYLILYEGKAPAQSLKDLLSLELKLELGGLFR